MSRLVHQSHTVANNRHRTRSRTHPPPPHPPPPLPFGLSHPLVKHSTLLMGWPMESAKQPRPTAVAVVVLMTTTFHIHFAFLSFALVLLLPRSSVMYSVLVDSCTVIAGTP